MRAPLRIDIRKRDLMRAAYWVVASRHVRKPIAGIRRQWKALGGSSKPLVCLSVRSAFDLFLSVRDLPRGSEVAISAITHPDMPRLLRAHGLVPVPLDLEPSTLAPTLATLDRVVSPKTRAVLLTHLLGGSAPTEDIAEYCKSRGLELWEDCAQRFPDVRPRSDVSAVSFYSFGPLKTATALLGAIADVQDPSLRAAMQQRQAGYPAYRRTALAWRTGKLAVLAELASHPLAYGAVVTTAERMGLDPRTTLRSASKSFGNATSFEGLRQRPSAPTLRLLAHRLDLTNSHAGAKTALAGELTARIGKARVLGSASNSHHWLFVVRSVHPEKLQRDLLSAGFDALRGISNLEVVSAPEERPETQVSQAADILRRAVVIPLHPDYTQSELEQLSDCVHADV